MNPGNKPERSTLNMDSASKPDDSDATLRRPMNAFLLFCKRHRSIVKNGHPWLDNRSCTKMLADMWAVLDWDEKTKYLQLARECKLAFMKAHPNYKWCGSSKQNAKGSSPTMRTRNRSPSKHVHKPGSGVWSPDSWSQHKAPSSSSQISAGKLADPCDMGGLSLLLLAGEQTMSKSTPVSQPEAKTSPSPQSPKSKLFEFAEMCSDQLDLECKPTQPTSHDEPPPLYKNDYNANFTLIDETSCKKVTGGKLETFGGENQTVHPPNRATSCATDPISHEQKMNVFCTGETTDNDWIQSPAKDTPVTNGSKNPPRLTKNVEVEPWYSSCQQSDKFSTLGSTVPCSTDEDHCDDVLDLPSSSDGGDWMEEQGIRRTSSRSCKGRLYREFVMEGMLESLQRPERPFNCKKSWKQPDGSSLSDGDDVVFEPNPDKPRRGSRRKIRERTVSGCGSLPNSLDYDYGEIDVEARLACLPQYSPDQFKPKGKCHRLKKSTCLYKNATFIKKEGKSSPRRASKEQSSGFCSSRRDQLAGSRKRKAPKSSILHLTLSDRDRSCQVSAGICSNLGQFVISNHQQIRERGVSSSCKSSSDVSKQPSQIQTTRNKASSGESVSVSGIETSAYVSPVIVDSHHLPRTTSHVITAASSMHRSVLTVS
ncbi:uncharacterized protein LOC110982057 [Acanthaster planci]|uniref:Uncharacterized protein LOC110982057 n=1 Tax=Acanthaster planci TaxID=133434 RepID=A0A8B7YTT3_ACAPL|nr:uncharacterized protein LOC110982057 [Acanthaster planci]